MILTKRKSNSGSFKKGQTPWNKGKKASADTRKKLSLAHQNPSAEIRKKMSLAKKGKPSWNKGKKWSTSTRKKISLAKQNPSAATRKKMSLAKKGKRLSPEHIAKIRLANKNPSVATRKKISLALKGKAPWNKGGKHSTEHVMKIALANKGKKRSAATRRKQSRAHNKILTEEYRKKLSIALKGRKIPAKIGKKISIAHQNRSVKEKKKSSKRRLVTIKKRYPKGNVPGTFGHTPWHKGKTGVFSDEAIEKIRKSRASQKFPFKDSKPELLVQSILKKNHIDFKKHKNFKLSKSYHQADVVIEPNHVIEVFGDYWHFNPKMFDGETVQRQGHKGILKAKDVWEYDKYVINGMKKLGCKVLVIWESELNELDRTTKKILKFIEKK